MIESHPMGYLDRNPTKRAVLSDFPSDDILAFQTFVAYVHNTIGDVVKCDRKVPPPVISMPLTSFLDLLLKRS